MTTPTPRGWQPEISDALAWTDFESRLIDYAIDLTGPFTPDRLGVAWALLDGATFAVYFPGQLPAPLAQPGPCPQGVPDRENWKVELKNYETQQTALHTLRQFILKEIPPHLLRPMEIESSLRTRSTEYIFMQLHNQFRHLKEIDIKVLKRNLTKPYSDDHKISQFTSQQLHILNQLNMAGQPLNNMDATEAIKSSFNIMDFSPCWTEFAKDHGALVDQTPANLCAFIVTFVEQRLEHHRAARIALGTANSASAIPLLQNNGIVETELVANSNNAAAAAVKATKSRKTASPRLPPPGFPPYWCWSCPNPNNHWSHNCPNRLPGHKWKATKEDPQQAKHS